MHCRRAGAGDMAIALVAFTPYERRLRSKMSIRLESIEQGPLKTNEAFRQPRVDLRCYLEAAHSLGQVLSMAPW